MSKRPKILYAPFKSYEMQEKAEQGIKESIEKEISIEAIADEVAEDNNNTIISDAAEAKAIIKYLKDKE